MTRKEFYLNLWEALEFHEADFGTDDLHTFMELNFDEDSSLSEWTFSSFNCFAIDAATDGFWEAVRMSDLHYPGEDDEDEEDEDE